MSFTCSHSFVHNRPMNNLRFCIGLAVIFLFSSPALAEVKPWGLGVIISNPTGFSVKHRMSHRNSIDAALGYSFGNNDHIVIHGTYLWEFNSEIKIAQAYLGYYFGVGGSLYSHDHDNNKSHSHRWGNDADDDETALAVRGSAGLNYYFNRPSIEVFAELALDFFFVPSTEADFGIAIGGRYYF